MDYIYDLHAKYVYTFFCLHIKLIFALYLKNRNLLPTSRISFVTTQLYNFIQFSWHASNNLIFHCSYVNSNRQLYNILFMKNQQRKLIFLSTHILKHYALNQCHNYYQRFLRRFWSTSYFIYIFKYHNQNHHYRQNP